MLMLLYCPIFAITLFEILSSEILQKFLLTTSLHIFDCKVIVPSVTWDGGISVIPRFISFLTFPSGLLRYLFKKITQKFYITKIVEYIIAYRLNGTQETLFVFGVFPGYMVVASLWKFRSQSEGIWFYEQPVA